MKYNVKETIEHVGKIYSLFYDARVASKQVKLLRQWGECEEAERVEKDWVEFLTLIRDRIERSLKYNFDKG